MRRNARGRPEWTSRWKHTRSSYIYQLEALIAALRGGTPMPTGPDDAVATAQLIDRCYRAADLPLRPRAAHPPVKETAR